MTFFVGLILGLLVGALLVLFIDALAFKKTRDPDEWP